VASKGGRGIVSSIADLTIAVFICDSRLSTVADDVIGMPSNDDP
jgi:hypothetical protein